MNYWKSCSMKKVFFVLFFVLSCLLVSGQGLSKSEVDSLVSLYTEQGKYGSVSEMLVTYANQEHCNGNLEIALEYQIKNCEFVEQHIDSFATNGLTLKDFFANYGMVFVLQRDLNQTIDAIDTYLGLSQAIKTYSPEDLPFYANLIAGTLGECTIMPWADSVYCLQDAIDVVKRQEITEDNVKKYLWFCKCFNMNRMYNSYENNAFTQNRIDEIENWYLHNCDYILELDGHLYRKEILEYCFDYADLLYLFAGAIAAQKQDLSEAIELYNKEISVLSSVGIEDDMISLKIASCYARIANDYYQLGNLPLCKEYCDKAFPIIFNLNHSDSYEYCDVLGALSNVLFNTNQRGLAAKYKLMEINVREELDMTVSLTDWAQYFIYIVSSNPEEVILRNRNLGNVRESESGNADYYQILGRAYSMLMDSNDKYRDTAEIYFYKADSVLLVNNDYYEKYGMKNIALGNLYDDWAKHYSRLGQREKSYEYSVKALQYFPNTFYSYYNVSLKSALLHDTVAIHEYLPRYYYGMEDDLCSMLPVLGSVESDIYLGNGESNLYHIPEWVSRNPTDSVSVCIAYDAALLMKGLTLRYNILSPYFDSHPEMINAKIELDRLRDSIYSISEDNDRLLALHRYELKEREMLRIVNVELANVHWKDVVAELNEDEACIEFVKYTANSYSWCDSVPKPHYAALVLLPNGHAPAFVDLFDEEELKDVYELQPKSYDMEIGQILYSKIWGKMQQYIDGKNKVYFSPMGLLNLINIELLIDSVGETATERFNLYRVSSTRTLLKRGEMREIHSIVTFGGVDFDKACDNSDVLCNVNTRGNWAYLKNTLLEVNTINDMLKKCGVDIKTYTRANATESAFKRFDGTQSDIIHIASHGFYIPQSQRTTIPYFSNSVSTENIQDELFFSGLILSGGQKAWNDSVFNPNNNDGILTAYEISKLDLHNVNLVVLSACETGLGDDLFDGIFGLQRAFKKAGVKSILMSLWHVDDKATSEYMSLFYEKLMNGHSAHDAYIGTVLSMKEKYPDANYWASFVLLD